VIKKDISYEDLDGNTVVKTFHFNLSTAELADMALTSEGGGGLADEIRKIQATADTNLVLKSFKKILEASVGKRVGDRFVKDEETKSDFMDTEAYGSLFMELATDPAKMIEFVRGVIPKNLETRLNQQITDQGLQVEGWTQPERKVETVLVDLEAVAASIPKAEEPKDDITKYTRAQLMEMDEDKFYTLVGSDSRKWTKAVLSIAMARRAAEK
jgi:hypothetical protein